MSSLRKRLTLLLVAIGLALVVPGGCASRSAPQVGVDAGRTRLSAADEALLEDLSKRSFQFFWDHADPGTGIVRDRARIDGSPVPTNARDVGSIASVGFGLSGLCIAAERGWV